MGTITIPMVRDFEPHIFEKKVTFANTAAGTVNLATVTGRVGLRCIGFCTVDLVEGGGGAATIEVGISGSTALFIPQIAADTLDAGEFWQSNAPSAGESIGATFAWDRHIILGNGQDLILTIGTDPIASGEIIFHIQWRPYIQGGLVVPA